MGAERRGTRQRGGDDPTSQQRGDRGTDTTSLTAVSRRARPSGVSAGPRKISVAVTVSSEPPNSASISAVAVATSLSSSRNTVIGPRGEPGEPRTEP